MTINCPTLHPQDYGVFSKTLYESIKGKRIPISGSIEITMRCNLRCQHCYIPFSKRKGISQRELTVAEFRRLFAEIADAGCLWLLITGGEPLLRPDFLEIYDTAKKMGFIITLFTNGTLITESIINHLAEFRPFSIEISLYGYSQETYENVTGIPGSFNRCMRGIELVLNRGLPLKIKSPLILANKHEIHKTKQFVENLGLDFRFDPVINAGLDGNIGPTTSRLKPEEIVNIQGSYPEFITDWNDNIQKSTLQLKKSKNYYVCNAGKLGFHIDSYGKMYLCMVDRRVGFDLRKGSFIEGWEDFFPKLLNLEYHQDIECIGCELRSVCAQCPAMAYLETGDPEKIVPFLCELAHKKYFAFSKHEKLSMKRQQIVFPD
jgi:radical SAM protein with 4Fe4S-binding SPASM domain